MKPVVKEEIQKIAPSQNESWTDNMPSRHQQWFLGNCYVCNTFGHKAMECEAYQKHNYKYLYKNGYASVFKEE